MTVWWPPLSTARKRPYYQAKDNFCGLSLTHVRCPRYPNIVQLLKSPPVPQEWNQVVLSKRGVVRRPVQPRIYGHIVIAIRRLKARHQIVPLPYPRDGFRITRKMLQRLVRWRHEKQYENCMYIHLHNTQIFSCLYLHETIHKNRKSKWDGR